MKTEDGYIIRKCLDGDSAVFGFLVDKYKASVFAFAYDRLRNFHDAEDVAQEVFIKAYQNLRSLRRWDSFLPWIYSITSNLCKNWSRGQSRRPDGQFIEDQDPAALEASSETIHQEELALEPLREALDSLPKMYRQVLTLHYLGGMSSMEIARFVGASPAAIRKRLSKARSLLREEMIAMMSATYEGQRLQANFTFRIVEIAKRMKIHSIPRMAGLPLGLSLAAGVIIAVISVSPFLTALNPMNTISGSPLPSETKALKTGEIPVDVLKAPNISIIANIQTDGGDAKPPVASMAAQGQGDTWTRKADMPESRFIFSTSLVNGKIYVIGGSMNGLEAPGSTVVEYDPDAETWTKKADMPTPRAFHSASVVDGKIYVMGGADEQIIDTSTVEMYEPTTDRWERKADMSVPRTAFSSCVVDGKIYAIGSGGLGKFPPVEVYDPLVDTWTPLIAIPNARYAVSAEAVNGKIYVISGAVGDVSVSTVEEYDPATNEWTRKADIPTPREYCSTSVVDGIIYAMGGAFFPGGVIHTMPQSVEAYDPATDTWTIKADMPTPRIFFSTCAVGGQIYALGGLPRFVFLPALKGPIASLSALEVYDTGFVGIDANGKLPTTWGGVKKEEHTRSRR